jgi:hypothetical protein
MPSLATRRAAQRQVLLPPQQATFAALQRELGSWLHVMFAWRGGLEFNLWPRLAYLGLHGNHAAEGFFKKMKEKEFQ